MIEKGDLAPAEQLLRRFLAQGRQPDRLTISSARCSRPRDAQTKRSASSSRPFSATRPCSTLVSTSPASTSVRSATPTRPPSCAARPPSGPSIAIWRSTLADGRARGRSPAAGRAAAPVGRRSVQVGPSPAAARPIAVGAEERSGGLGLAAPGARVGSQLGGRAARLRRGPAGFAHPRRRHPDPRRPHSDASPWWPGTTTWREWRSSGPGTLAAAVSFLQEAMRLEPDQAPTLIALGRALNRRAALRRGQAAPAPRPEPAAGERRGGGRAGRSRGRAWASSRTPRSTRGGPSPGRATTPPRAWSSPSCS